MSTDINTLNLADNGDGMVPISDNRSTTFVNNEQPAFSEPEKNKPVQDKLVTSVPKFLNEQGSRSMVGLASTGLVAAVVFYFVKDQIVKP